MASPDINFWKKVTWINSWAVLLACGLIVTSIWYFGYTEQGKYVKQQIDQFVYSNLNNFFKYIKGKKETLSIDNFLFLTPTPTPTPTSSPNLIEPNNWINPSNNIQQEATNPTTTTPTEPVSNSNLPPIPDTTSLINQTTQIIDTLTQSILNTFPVPKITPTPTIHPQKIIRKIIKKSPAPIPTTTPNIKSSKQQNNQLQQNQNGIQNNIQKQQLQQPLQQLPLRPLQPIIPHLPGKI